MQREDIARLLKAALAAREHAYAPYSHYPVGAAVEAVDSTIFTGCNVENVSYPCGLCAERNAIGSAVAAGKRSFTALAVVGSRSDFTTPCGLCRQVIAEFRIPLIIVGKSETDYRVYRAEELLPGAFDESGLRR